MEMPFMMYAHHSEAIEGFIHDLATSSNPNDSTVQITAARNNGLDLDALDDYDRTYISRKLARYYGIQIEEI